MSEEGFHWNSDDYFPYLIQNNKNSVLALEYLVDDLHNGKEATIDKFLSHCGSEDFLWGLVKLMSYTDARISGNSAYVIGTIAETENGTERIIDLLNSKSNSEAKNILLYMVNMLKSTDSECLMNAAGTIGTISESKLGRDWLLTQDLLDEAIKLCTNLLDHQNLWVSSNAALVLARVSIEDNGCKCLLNHELSSVILKKLIHSLGSDEAGRGMNCAFAIGRLCDHEEGREAILTLNRDLNKLIVILTTMIDQNNDFGCTKNACFALSCLAGNDKAHEIIINHDSFEKLMTALCKLLVNTFDAETQWFAAMLIRVLASLPNGIVKLRTLAIVENTLRTLSEKANTYSDVREEVDLTLDLLKRLEKPNAPQAGEIGATEVLLKWDQVIVKNGLHVQYLLYNDTTCIYNGVETSFRVTDLFPYTQYTFQLQAYTVEDNDKSPFSDQTQITTDESIPTLPLNLKCAGSTTTLLKIVWEPPERSNGVLKGYFIFNGTLCLDQTNDQMYIITGLSPGTSYEVHVCAATSKGKGEKATMTASTCELGDQTPEKPTFGLIGKREILVRWAPPEVLAGKLNKYELNMNGKCVYSGTALEYQVGMLKPDTEYKFEVVAVTNEGKFKSKIAKTHTLKDEYDPERAPLYPGPVNFQSTQVPSALVVTHESQSNNKKRVSVVESDRILQRNQNTQKMKTAKNREKVTTIECEDFSSISKNTLSDNGTLPSLTHVNKEDDAASRITNKTNNYNNQTNQQMFRPPLNNVYSLISRNKEQLPQRSGTFHHTSIHKTSHQSKNVYDIHHNGQYKTSNPLNSFERAKTFGVFNNNNNNSKYNLRRIQHTAVNPTPLITLNIKELQPEFPMLPQNIPYMGTFNTKTSVNLGNQTEQIRIAPVLTQTTTQTIEPPNVQDSRILNNFIPMQYRYTIKKLQKEKPMKLDELSAIMRANTFVGDQFRMPRVTK